MTVFWNFMVWIISLMLEKKVFTGIAPAYMLHTHPLPPHPSTSLLVQPFWKKNTGCWEHLVCSLVDFVLIVKINSGYQLQFQKLSRRVKQKSGKGGVEKKGRGGEGRHCSLTVVFAKKTAKAPFFNFLHNTVVLPLSSESCLFMLLRKSHRANTTREEQDVFSTKLLADSSCCRAFIFRNDKRSRKNTVNFR